MSLINKYLPTLQLICKIRTNKGKEAVLKQFCKDDEFICVLRQIAKNTYLSKSILPIKKKHIKRLRKHSKVIKAVAQKSPGYKKLAVQSGGYLPIVIPLITSILGEIIGNQSNNGRN